MSRKYRSNYDFLDEIREDYRIKVQNGEIRNHDKVPFICMEHGEYWQTLDKHSSGKSCPKCGYKNVSQKLIKRNYPYINEIRFDYRSKILNGEIRVIEKVPFICNIHGEYWQTLHSHDGGQGCPKCGDIKISQKQIRTNYDFIDEVRPDYQVKVKNGEIKNYEKIPFICQKHGEYWQDLSHHEHRKSGCPICAELKRKISHRKKEYNFIDDIREDYQIKIFNGEINGKNKVPFIDCKKHGEYWQSLEVHSRGCGCPTCGKIISKTEIEVFEYVKSILPNTEVKNNTRKLDVENPTKELDIYIPELNIGIEYDGLIWHSEKYHINKYNLSNKTKLFNDIGIRVIHIFEDEWLNQRNLIQNKLKHILNVDTSEKIYGRNCYVKEIDLDTCREFLNNNHLQGYYRSKYRYGLFTKDNNLVAVMTFINSKISSSLKDWELSRYSTNCNVIGGFGKLLKYAQKEIGFKKLITFADLRWSDPNNNIYLKNGFIQEYITKPNYFYINNIMRRIYRFAMRKSMLSKKLTNYDPNLTEVENCNNNGYYRLFDCGNIKYIKEF